MRELGLAVNTQTIAMHYRDLIDALVIDESDAADETTAGMPIMVTRTIMRNLADRVRLAREVIAYADNLLRPSCVARAGRVGQ